MSASLTRRTALAVAVSLAFYRPAMASDPFLKVAKRPGAATFDLTPLDRAAPA